MYDPRSEVNYRRKLAEGYLKEAKRAYDRGDWRDTVANAQLAAENAAKAIIAIYRAPSWTHDPYYELLDILDNLPEDVRERAREVAEIAHTLAPEHGRTTYGEPARGLTPWELYTREDAEKALKLAQKAIENLDRILKRLSIEM